MTEAARITDILSREEIKAFTELSDWHGLFSVLTTWGIIAASFVLVAYVPTWWAVTIALVLLGGRHLALAILMHEASHFSLFRTRRLNDVLGTWLCAAPAWLHLKLYRTHHLAHHAHTGTERDTDLCLVEPFPTTRAGVVRKFARDLVGLSGLKRVLALFLMDIGYLTYTASLGATVVPRAQRPLPVMLGTALRRLGPVFLTNIILWGILYLSGHGTLYLLWVVSYLTTFSMFVRWRAMAEHACTENSLNMFRNTRTTYANPLARLTVAPHYVNYHLEHHVLMTVPHYRLPALHKILKERGIYEESPLATGYVDVLRKVTA